ncbi:hypothetical protein EJ04DRAFT_66945 [Polyplosphaeria fusca]|uniref:Uncharacterized protein n=1 Tax=Polyplosphaeria fusca TaxID=682080 RepID=A0A9P4QRA4_9PLEO|nr:hypothetical protein EJ04DRAFT_66945 [Polyplosphaeria fusca]
MFMQYICRSGGEGGDCTCRRRTSSWLKVGLFPRSPKAHVLRQSQPCLQCSCIFVIIASVKEVGRELSCKRQRSRGAQTEPNSKEVTIHNRNHAPSSPSECRKSERRECTQEQTRDYTVVTYP